jgi:integrase
MTGMNLGFIANQLGHSMQMLLTTYNRRSTPDKTGAEPGSWSNA